MKTIATTKYLEFKSVKSPSGHDWCYVKRTNDSNEHDSAVIITTLIKNNDDYDFLFIKTKRPPLYAENKSEFCLESPAGLIGDNDINEKLLDCAKKELLEETGLIASKLYLELLNSSSSSGLTSETLSYITAVVDNQKIVQPPVTDGGIILEWLKVPSKDVLHFLQSQNNKSLSIASATVCGIYFALNRINK